MIQYVNDKPRFIKVEEYTTKSGQKKNRYAEQQVTVVRGIKHKFHNILY